MSDTYNSGRWRQNAAGRTTPRWPPRCRDACEVTAVVPGRLPGRSGRSEGEGR